MRISWLIAVVVAFLCGRVLVGSIAWACSCGPTGTDADGLYEFPGGIVSLDDEHVPNEGWPTFLVGRLAVDADETGEFVLLDGDTEEVALTLVVDAL